VPGVDERDIAQTCLHDVLRDNRAMATIYDTELRDLRENGLGRTAQYTSSGGAPA
jgi:hypothetical protein